MSEEEIEFLESESVENIQFREIGKHVVQPRHDKEDFVRVGWLSISNKYGFVIMGKPTSFLLIKTEIAFDSLKNDQDIDAKDIIEVKLTEHTTQHIKLSKLSLSSDELTIAATIGNKVLLFDVRSLHNKVQYKPFFLLT
jgi:hypothetical protein